MCTHCECGTVSWDDIPQWYKDMCIESSPEDEWVMDTEYFEEMERKRVQALIDEL